MGLAYGAAESKDDGYAKRIGVIVAPDGTIKQFVPKADARSFPQEALKLL